MLSLSVAGLAGCLNAQSDEGPAIISRVHTVVIDPTVEDMVERHGDDYAAFFRELIQTTLVVRVEQEGDYTLEYTDKDGAVQSQALSGMKPGEPRSVSGADPLAPAVLKRGEDTLVTRAGIDGEWWRIGDVPLGFNMSEGAKGLYDFTSRIEETISLENLDLQEQGFVVDRANFQLQLPLEGEVGYDLAAASGDEGSPLTLTGAIEIPSSAGDLVTLEIEATSQGEAGKAGIIAGVDEARANGSLRTWWKDGEPVAGQFLGGEYTADPRAIVWAEGFFAQMAEGQNCAGKTKADRCEPDELDTVEGTQEADEKEAFPVDEYPRLDDPEMNATEREEAEKMLDLLRAFYALDIVRGDKLTITAQANEEDFAKMGGTEAPRMSVRFDFVLEAVANEDVTVPAGTFSALKLTEELTTQMNVQQFDNPGTGQPLLSSFEMDEIIARSTFWLEEDTWRPLKMEASIPIDIDALLKRMMSSVSDSAWSEIGGKPIDDGDWRITMTAESSYVAKELAGATHYAPLVGLLLAHALSSSSSAPMMWAMQSAGMGMGSMFGPSYGGEAGTEYAPGYEVDPAPREPPVLSLASEGPAVDGVATYTVSASNLDWASVGVQVDGQDLSQAYLEDGSCPTPIESEYALCRDGVSLDGYEPMEAGDELRVFASSGQSLMLVDYETNTVLVRLTIS